MSNRQTDQCQLTIKQQSRIAILHLQKVARNQPLASVLAVLRWSLLRCIVQYNKFTSVHKLGYDAHSSYCKSTCISSSPLTKRRRRAVLLPVERKARHTYTFDYMILDTTFHYHSLMAIFNRFIKSWRASSRSEGSFERSQKSPEVLACEKHN